MEENKKYISVLSFKSGIDVRMFAVSSEEEAIELSIIYMDLIEENVTHNESDIIIYPLDSFEVIDKEMIDNFLEENVENLVEKYNQMVGYYSGIRIKSCNEETSAIIKDFMKHPKYGRIEWPHFDGCGYGIEEFSKSYDCTELFNKLGKYLPKVITFENI